MTDDRGRHYLLARHGQKPWCKPDPCYLYSLAEADEAVRDLRARYGDRYCFVDAGVPATCEENHPYNGSNCELAHGHAGPCAYVEPRGNVTRRWQGAEELADA